MLAIVPTSYFNLSLFIHSLLILAFSAALFRGAIKAPSITLITIFLKSSMLNSVLFIRSSYSSIIFTLETVSLSVLIVTLTPFLYNSSIVLYISSTAFVCILLVGHISSTISFCLSSPISPGSSSDLTPCPILFAPQF